MTDDRGQTTERERDERVVVGPIRRTDWRPLPCFVPRERHDFNPNSRSVASFCAPHRSTSVSPTPFLPVWVAP
jgi:hypothetical protein